MTVRAVVATLVLVGCAAPPAAEAPPPAAPFQLANALDARVELSVAELDPLRPEGVLRIVLTNHTDASVYAPTAYDGRRVVLFGLGADAMRLVPRIPTGAAVAPLAPGESRVVLERPLAQLLALGGPPWGCAEEWRGTYPAVTPIQGRWHATPGELSALAWFWAAVDPAPGSPPPPEAQRAALEVAPCFTARLETTVQAVDTARLEGRLRLWIENPHARPVSLAPLRYDGTAPLVVLNVWRLRPAEPGPAPTAPLGPGERRLVLDEPLADLLLAEERWEVPPAFASWRPSPLIGTAQRPLQLWAVVGPAPDGSPQRPVDLELGFLR